MTLNIPSPLPEDLAPLLARAARAYNRDGKWGVQQFIKTLSEAERMQLAVELQAGAITFAVDLLARELGIK